MRHSATPIFSRAKPKLNVNFGNLSCAVQAGLTKSNQWMGVAEETTRISGSTRERPRETDLDRYEG